MQKTTTRCIYEALPDQLENMKAKFLRLVENLASNTIEMTS